jgi:hypothetical protein
MWTQCVIEICGESPWRMHWPASRDDDRIMTDFIIIMSLRNTAYAVVENAKMHVIEFHLSYLGVPPPPFPVADWHLSKLKLAMAKEKPEGRRVRPALGPDAVSAICAKLYTTLLIAGPVQQRLYANVGAAIAFIFEKALRAGEACPGLGYSPTKHLSRSTIAGALISREQMQSRGQALIIQPPVRKTAYTNVVTAQKTNQPLVFDTMSDADYSFCKWGPLLEQYDACAPHKRSTTPAFRAGGALSAALATGDIRNILCVVAQSAVPDWEVYDYGAHSLRIGRENAWRATDKATPEFLNDMTTHSTTEGRMPYSRMQIEEILQVDRAAESVKLSPVETAYKFDADRSSDRPAVYMAQDMGGTYTRVLSTTVALQYVDPLDDLEESEDDSFVPSLEDVASAPLTAQTTLKRERASTAAASAAPPAKKPRGRPKSGMTWDPVRSIWVVSGQPTVFSWTR